MDNNKIFKNGDGNIFQCMCFDFYPMGTKIIMIVNSLKVVFKEAPDNF